ncbi:hypothetical protein [Treponema pedis]|nr:hypothetical protein [Treponema pedis]
MNYKNHITPASTWHCGGACKCRLSECYVDAHGGALLERKNE